MRHSLVLNPRAFTGALRPDPLVETAPDVVRLRTGVSYFFVALLWAHVPVIAAMASYNETNVPAQIAMACAIATIASWAVMLDRAGPATRSIVGMALTGMPILVVFNGAGPWQIDYHMYFFAIFAMLVAYVDWRPIVAASVLTSAHHEIFAMLDPLRVFPDEVGVGRVALHAGIVALECGVLIWITAQLRRLFHDLVLARGEAEAAEHRASTYAKQLEAANVELESFARTVAHDLRAPLRSIDGFSDALNEDHGPRLPPEAVRDLHLISRSAKHLGEMVNALLDFSRMGADGLHRERVMPDTVALAALARLNGRSAEGGPEIVISGLPPCSADPVLLGCVFQNLLDNAIKFTRHRQGARIEIGAVAGDQPVYYVRDNGAGFDMSKSDRLFNIFSRLHRDERFPGTGTGLATVKRIVTKHGGRIWAEGAPDKGATFFFTLEPAVSEMVALAPAV
jgi:signal transduction histidine kinase